jgi:hypothetical protein
MASDIVITPNRGSTTVNAKIDFTGASTASSQIRLEVLPDNSLSFVGTTGSLFSIADSVTGSLMSVNDASGLPILEVFDTDKVVMGQYNQNTLVVNGTQVGIGTGSPTNKLTIAGVNSNGITLTGSNATITSAGTTPNLILSAGTNIYLRPTSGYTVTVDTGNGLQATTGDIRAPSFIDSADSTYSLDLNSTADTALRIRGGAVFGPNSTWSRYLMVGGNGRSNYTDNTQYASVTTTNGNLHLDAASGFNSYINWYDGTDLIVGAGDSSTERFRVYGSSNYTFASGEIRSPVFKDSADTAYYVDPNATSVLSKLSIGNAPYVSSIQAGALELGRTDTNYQYTSGWTGSMQGGILANCSDNWEFVIHDSGHRLASAFEFRGAGTNVMRLGRDLGWGVTPIEIPGNLTVAGNLTVNGTTTTVNSTTVTIDDPIFTLGGDTAPASDDNKDRGIEFRWHNGTAAKAGFFGFDDSTGYFTFIPDATNTSEVFSGTQGDIQASNFRGNLIGNVTGNVSGTAGGETLATVTGRGASTASQISVSSASGGSMFTGTKAGGTYSDQASGATFKSILDNTNGSAGFGFVSYYGGSSGTIGASIRADGFTTLTYNPVASLANNAFSITTGNYGSLHFDNGEGTTGNARQTGITWRGGSTNVVQAGIYVSQNSTTGTTMALATTDNYSTGPQIGMTISTTGVVNFPRNRPTYAGNVILDAANYNSYAPTLTGTGASGTWGISITGNAATATTLQTARTIAGVSFNGSANITLTGQNISTSSGTAANDIEVAKYLRWKNYGNNHILIDASAGTNPAGGAIDRYTPGNTINSTGAGSNTWGEAISLMGWNGSATYGVRVDRARSIDNQANSATITATSANTASQIVQRDSNGDFSARNITTQDYYTNGWFRNNNSNSGLYNQSTYLHLSSTGANTSYLDISTVGSTNSGIRFYTGGHVNTLRGYIVANTSNELMLWNAGGSYSARFTSTQSEIYQDTYVPTLYGNIMYDRQSTSFYVDPGSTSVLNRLNVAGYPMRSSATIDMSNTGTYATTNYYPVTIPLVYGMPTRMRIVNALNSNVPSWATHGSGFTCHVEWTSNGSGWGTIAVQRSIHRYTEGYTNSTICGGITQMTNSSTEVIWLRGGGIYYFEADADVTPTPRSTTYTVNSQSVTFQSSAVNDVLSAATDTRPSFQRLNLTQSTGTAPMTVSSTTLVTNLNADLLDGYNSAETGSSIILRTQSNGYLNIDNWIQVGSAGLYSSVNSAHWTPNQTGAYSPWRIINSRGSYGGIYDDYSGVNWMHDSAGNGGIYRQANSRWFLYHNVSENCLGIGGSSTLNGWRARVNGALYTDAGTYSSAFYASSNSTYYLDLAGAVSGRINGRIYIGTTTSYTAGGSPNLTIVKTSAGARADHLELRNESTNANTACSINFMMTGGDSSNPNARIVSTRSASFDGTLEFYVGGNLTTGIFINSSGNVGIGRTDPGYKLDVNGSTRIVTALGVGTAPSGTTGEIRATDNITAYYSDERLKTKLGAIENPIEKVKSLSGFYFEANETAVALGYQKKREVGVSAQEVQAILPEIIAPAPIDDKYMTVRYEKLIPLLIEAIKEQQKQIEELKSLLSNNK